MTNVITLPEREKLPIGSQRQRVFYLGFVYRGPPLMQEVQDVYLKRHGRKDGTRRWSIITYSKYFEWDVRSYSLEAPPNNEIFPHKHLYPLQPLQSIQVTCSTCRTCTPI